MTDEQPSGYTDGFTFLKGGETIFSPSSEGSFDWEESAARVRQDISDAMNARNVAFLLGSGCSSLVNNSEQVGIPTMAPMARAFIENVGEEGDLLYATQSERQTLRDVIGLDIEADKYKKNIEHLMEVLYSYQFILNHCGDSPISQASGTIESLINKVKSHVIKCCSEGSFSNGDESVLNLYQAFYRKLIYRDSSLPKPWLFTTNYDLFNETAMDRVGALYNNGFSGTVERRFNPAVFRYSLAEQIGLTSNKWTTVNSYVFLCKLHGSINWIEDRKTLFPIREVQLPIPNEPARVMIYPTPAKQNSSFGSPYSDLFREFQQRIVQEQSVLFVLGYGFGDEHINNIIFQALTIPTFRLVIFSQLDASDIISDLVALKDPRIWIIGGNGETNDKSAHYFNTFVESFMPEPPGTKVDTAIEKVLKELIAKEEPESTGEQNVN